MALQSSTDQQNGSPSSPYTSTDSCAPPSLGFRIINNPIIAKAILRHLSNVVDIISFRTVCPCTNDIVSLYLRRDATALDFSDLHEFNSIRVASFLTDKPMQQFGRWEVLQHLVLSNTKVDTAFILCALLYCFNFPTHAHRLGHLQLGVTDGKLPQSWSVRQLQTLMFKDCENVDMSLILAVMQRVLWRDYLLPYWNGMELTLDERNAYAKVESVYRVLHSNFVWAGPPPASVADIDRCGLANATSLRKIGAANCKNLWVDHERFAGTPKWNGGQKCGSAKEVGLLNSIFGSFGVEVDVTFCNGYCNVNNAFLKDHDGDVDHTYGRLDEYEAIIDTYEPNKVFSLGNFGDFPVAKAPKYLPRMPYDTSVTYSDGRIFYFPDNPKPPYPAIPGTDSAAFRLNRATIGAVLVNFDKYPVEQQSYVLWKLIDFELTQVPGLEQRLQSESENELADLHTNLLRQLLIESNTRNSSLTNNVPVPGQDPYDIPTSATDPYDIALHLKSDKTLLALVQQLLSYPLPRRLTPPGMLCRDENRVRWFDRPVALPDDPRGLCYKCNRELWLCQTCNSQLRIYCGECMAEASDQHSHYPKFSNGAERLLRALG